MAISNSEYKQIHSTLPSGDNNVYNGSLSLGAFINNLITSFDEYTEMPKKETLPLENGRVPTNVWYIDEAEAKTKGEACISLWLRSDRKYMLQVINNSQSLNTDVSATESSSSIVFESNGEEVEVSFENLLYFQLPEKSDPINDLTYCTLKISGITPSTQSIKTWKSQQIPTVFLFSTDMPWMVDLDGVIIGLLYQPLLSLDQKNNSVLATEYTKENLIKIFSQYAPEFDILDNKLYVKPISELRTDNAIYDNALGQICLVPLRDYLVNKQHDWNNVTVEKRTGVLRFLSNKYNKPENNEFNPVDTVRGQQSDLINNKLCIQIKPAFRVATLAGDNVTFNWGSNGKSPWEEKDSYIYKNWDKTNPDRSIADVAPISLPLISCLGYNYNLHTTDTYRYTSICFVWGRVHGPYLDILSPASIPIIVERDLCNSSFSKDTWTFSLKDYKIEKRSASNYFDGPAFYIEKK